MNKIYKIGVVVVVYNGREYLDDLLNSLYRVKVPEGYTLEYFFVDNKSADDSVEFLKQNRRDNMELIELSRNLGFAGGNNVGIKKALSRGCRWILLLNQDTVVDPDFLSLLVKKGESDDKIFSLQPLLLYWSDKQRINSSGGMLHFLGIAYARDNLSFVEDTFSSLDEDIVYCSGAACLLRSDILRKIGLFDDKMESYHEDTEIGVRARIWGYKNVLVKEAKVYHKYVFLKSNSDVKKGISKYKYYLMERNRQYFAFKYYPALYFLLILPAYIALEIGVLSFSFLRGFWKEKIKSYLYILINFDKIIEERRNLRKQISCFDSQFYQVCRKFVPSISYQEIDNIVLEKIGNPFMKIYWKIILKLLCLRK